VQGIQEGKVLSLELIPQDPDRDKKLLGGAAYPVVLCKTAAGNDTVHMHMVGKLLVPGMQDLYNPGYSAKILFVCR